ncbi:MAG: sodium:proton antiporter NhaD [Candidatus Cyclobacteriaceae bacterium M3_2C_046]
MYSLILVIFLIGYLGITLEHPLKINKAAFALLIGVLCWAVFFVASGGIVHSHDKLYEHLSEIAGILFFLMGAMTIVELVDSHNGFQPITSRITTDNKVSLLWIVSLLTFFMSALLDNLTTAIVMVSLLRQILKNPEEQKFFSGMVIIAANAGGAWSPIGDVTTTMLWIGGQVTTANIMQSLFLPSLVAMLVPLIIVSFRSKGTFEKVNKTIYKKGINSRDTTIVLILGIASLLFVPIFKGVTGLPPYMGILLGLGLLWLTVDLLHLKKDDHIKHEFSVVKALQKIDTSSILFFLGILLAVGALETSGQLSTLSLFLDQSVGNYKVVIFITGVLSSIVDNVPLVAAAQGMYPMGPIASTDVTMGQFFPPDSPLWEFLAYCAGTGGSLLVIGSAAGVAVMGITKLDFMWYVRNISLWALIGYVSGAIIYLLLL